MHFTNKKGQFLMICTSKVGYFRRCILHWKLSLLRPFYTFLEHCFILIISFFKKMLIRTSQNSKINYKIKCRGLMPTSTRRRTGVDIQACNFPSEPCSSHEKTVIAICYDSFLNNYLTINKLNFFYSSYYNLFTNIFFFR